MRTIAELRETGYVVERAFMPLEAVTQINRIARRQLDARADPVEYEADLRYPGAPLSRTAAGGETVRRLLDAYGREPEFAAWATQPRVREWMQAYFGDAVVLSRVHHNCLMTKHPQFGSMTGWHRDMRFWAFARENLVSVWLALGEETIENGALWFVPGSHRIAFEGERFDESKFFRVDRDDNSALLSSAESPRLAPGDAVFFHCNTLHSAGKNRSAAVKFSLVFTYHARSNAATPGTRSASMPEVELRAPS